MSPGIVERSRPGTSWFPSSKRERRRGRRIRSCELEGILAADRRGQTRRSIFQLTTRPILDIWGGPRRVSYRRRGGGILGADLGLAWGASIGFGFGWIFDQSSRRNGPLLSGRLHGTDRNFFWSHCCAVPDYTSLSKSNACISGAAVGALFGLVIGILRERKLRQRITANS